MILVVGATGNTGSQLVRRLVAANTPFMALSRDPGRARATLGADVPIVQADLSSRPGLQRALEGVDRVYAAVGGTPDLVETEAALIDAAAAAGVKHFVKLSGVEVEPADAMIQTLHAKVERHLAASGMAWTVLGGNFFFQNFLGLASAIQQGALPMPTGAARGAMVDALDIARAAEVVLREDIGRHAGKRYRMCGPASLSHADAAVVFSRVLGREVRHVDLPGPAWEASMAGAGVPAWLAAQLTDVYTRFFGTPGAAAVHDDITRLTGAPPRDLAAFVEAHRGVFG